VEGVVLMQAAIVPAIHGKWDVKEVPTPHMLLLIRF